MKFPIEPLRHDGEIVAIVLRKSGVVFRMNSPFAIEKTNETLFVHLSRTELPNYRPLSLVELPSSQHAFFMFSRVNSLSAA